MPVVLIITEGHMDVHGPCCCQSLCRHLWSMLLPEARLVSMALMLAEAMLMFVVHVTPEVHGVAHSLYCQLNTC